MLCGNESEVNSVDNGPDFPGSLDCGEKIVLNLGSDGSGTITGNKSEVSEEDCHEEWAPNDLINGNLCGNRFSVGSRNLGVKPVVKVVT